MSRKSSSQRISDVSKRLHLMEQADHDRIRREATKTRMDWSEGSHFCNWRRYVGAPVKGIWHTFTDEQKVAIATDARSRAEEAEYD